MTRLKFKTHRNYTAIYHTYRLLYCKGHIQMTNNHSNVNMETKKNNREDKMTIKFNALRNYTTLYQTYQLLYCIGYVQMTSSHSNFKCGNRKKNWSKQNDNI